MLRNKVGLETIVILRESGFGGVITNYDDEAYGKIRIVIDGQELPDEEFFINDWYDFDSVVQCLSQMLVNNSSIPNWAIHTNYVKDGMPGPDAVSV